MFEILFLQPRESSNKHELDETTLINDFRSAVSQLELAEQRALVQSALKALGNELEYLEKVDVNEKTLMKISIDTERRDEAPSERNDEWNEREAEMLRRIEELEETNNNLTSSMEELDRQHSESIGKLLIE